MAYSLIIKRCMDVCVSLLLLVLFLPLLGLMAVFIKIDSTGPALFMQERLGKNGKVFKILKFRTMVIDAESMGDGVLIKDDTDTRVTKIGKFLRLRSLDELPQLWNILKGDMSLIGPRPPVTYHPYDGYVHYPDWAKKRFTMRPGVTGLAQITVRNSVPWDERMKVDLLYIENFSLKQDFSILLKTFTRVIKPSNIY